MNGSPCGSPQARAPREAGAAGPDFPSAFAKARADKLPRSGSRGPASPARGDRLRPAHLPPNEEPHASGRGKLDRHPAVCVPLIVGHYERSGEITIGDTALDAPSEREIARQERMKREG